MSNLYSKFESLLYCLAVTLLVFIPLYPKFPLLNVPGTFVAIRLEDLLIAITMVTWFSYILVTSQLRELLRDKLIRAMLLFWGIGLLSLFSSVFLTQTITPHLGVLHYLRRVELMMLLPIGYYAVTKRQQLRSAMLILTPVVLLINLYALGQKYLSWPVISTTNSEFSKGLILYLTPDARVNSTFAGHYDLAIFLVMTLVVCSAVIFAVKSYWKIYLLVISALSFLVLILTAARLSFIAVIVGIPLALWLVGKKLFILIIFFAAVAALIYPSQLRDRFVSTFTVNIFDQGERYGGRSETQTVRNRLNIPTLPYKIATPASEIGRLTAGSADLASDLAPGEPVDTTELGVYRSFTIRLNYEWPRAIRAFIKNPLLGTGYSSLGLATDNDYLRSIGEVGILGTLGFALVIVEVLKRLRKGLHSKDKFSRFLVAGVTSMVVAFLINGIFLDVFEASKVASMFWLVVGMSLAANKFENETT